MQPITDALGPRQTVAADGPDGPDMQQFVCSVCDQRHYDVNHYFHGVESSKCMWCLKYNKKRPAVKTVDAVDSKD